MKDQQSVQFSNIVHEEMDWAQPMADDADKSNLPVTSDVLKRFRLEVTGLPLKRTFAAIDTLFAAPLEYVGKRVTERLARNVEVHVEAVRKHRAKRGHAAPLNEENTSPAVAKGLWNWAESAAEVEPHDEVMSAAWQAVLDKVLEGEGGANELLETVRSLPSGVVRRFLIVFGRTREASLRARMRASLGLPFILYDADATNLENGGLIRRLVGTNGLIGVVLLTLVIYASMYYYNVKADIQAQKLFHSTPLRLEPKIDLVSTMPGEFTTLTLVFAVIMFFIASRICIPTRVGMEFVRLYREYRALQADHQR